MISVCLTTYNGEKFIRTQLDSILCQLGREDEIIISDDGSKDKTLQILESYQDSRIKIFHHDSSSVKTTFPLDKPTHNFEYALQQAKGDIIFLSDQDDKWLDEKVTKMVKALENADLAIHDCIVTDTDFNPIIPSYFNHIKVHQGVWKNAARATYLGCCMAFKRNILKEALPFPKTKVGHDLWLGIIADMKFKTVLVNEPLLCYRKHNANMTPSGKKSGYSIWFKINYRITIIFEIIKKLCK
ncbi:MAG: glycosyltransferase [Bacteroidaceae bacterium]|jgi:glycosyltransferase involved in cell wall biosynthesis|nr:glycosyltransferase [Bacteroidaceae bacterium]